MVTEFPNTAITLKPTYQAIKKKYLDKNGLYLLKAWTGPQTGTTGYPAHKWPAYVYVDITNKKGHGNGNVNTMKPQSGKLDATTIYNLSDFIHFKVADSSMLAFFTHEGISDTKIEVGDYVILVAMHVTTKETKRWTWQTYFWTPNPDKPDFPSTPLIVANRPKQLQGAPLHYAMSMGYTFMLPDKPYTGGTNIGTPIFAYNPYLEAGFDDSTFMNKGGTKSEITIPSSPLTILKTDMGVRTNCLSCHAQANYAPQDSIPTHFSFGYVGDRYVDMADPRFKGTLQLDFLWSLKPPNKNPKKAH
jgi:cytochrome c553